jgi:hypothetical protein
MRYAQILSVCWNACIPNFLPAPSTRTGQALMRFRDSRVVPP